MQRAHAVERAHAAQAVAEQAHGDRAGIEVLVRMDNGIYKEGRFFVFAARKSESVLQPDSLKYI